VRVDDLKHAKDLAEAGELDLSWDIVNRQLTTNPDDPLALLIASYIMEKSNKPVLAYHLARRVSELAPTRFEGWNNFGRAADMLWMVEVSERAIRRAINAARTDKDKATALLNLSALYINIGRFAEAEKLAEQSLETDYSAKGKANLGFCQLARRNWEEGWDNYKFSLGIMPRMKVQYADEPEWDGTKGQAVAIYGEQGIGDEISFASMLPDAGKDCKKVIIDCDKRLKNLFQRSFPWACVYGTRSDKAVDWAAEDRQIDASASMGSLGGIYRRSAESFDGEPYLTPDKDRVTMWEALWKSKGKPVIGIAWTGGISRTGSTYRQWSLDDLLPVFTSIDAHWVCLQYKDAEPEITEFLRRHPSVSLTQYPFATLSKDYDDTAALVASLDMVVCVQTAIAHLAGALGKKCIVCVPKNSQWRYGSDGDTIPWYKSVSVYRQQKLGEWSNVINRLANSVKREFGEKSQEAA
jgi:tetratricopeptide (TPR) repeat protein